MKPSESWESRVADLWKRIDEFAPEEFVLQVERLAAELPPASAEGLFERACAHDSTGHPDRAVPLYQQALVAGLTGIRRRRAVIQMASSMRNLGNPERAADLLAAELDAPSDELDEAAVSLTAPARYLPRYNKSLARYAQGILN